MKAVGITVLGYGKRTSGAERRHIALHRHVSRFGQTRIGLVVDIAIVLTLMGII